MSETTPIGDEQRMQALTRAYRSLAEMNEAIVRATDDLQLFAQTCRVAVEQAGYLGAWIGTVTPEGGVVPVARAGTLDDLVGEPGTTMRAGPGDDLV